MASSRITLPLVALVLFSSAALADDARRSQTRVSRDGRFEVRLVETGPKKCRLEVLKEGEPFWKHEACVGTLDDLFFVSDDGEQVWMIRTLPEKGTRRPKKGKYPAWTYTPVAVLMERGGKVLDQKLLNEFVRSKAGLNDVRQLKKYVKWLEGVLGVPGSPPRMNEQGRVVFETVERRRFELKFK